jgi:hypothetical protein
MGPGKVAAMIDAAERDGIDLAGSYAYTDSFTDMPMLEAVGHPVVVNPEKELRDAAEENDWPILEFQRPVSLEPRVQAPPKRVWIPVVAGAAGVAVAIAVTKRRTESG